MIDGFSQEWLHNGKILVFTFTRSSDEVVDAWYTATCQAYEQWPKDRPYLVLLDASRAILTTYARKKASELAGMSPELTGRSAIVIPASIIGHMITFFVNRSIPTPRERRVFFSRELALEWLEEMLM